MSIFHPLRSPEQAQRAEGSGNWSKSTPFVAACGRLSRLQSVPVAELIAMTSQVRLDAFALLCENKRTAEAISDVEFRHLRHFITYNRLLLIQLFKMH